jgi:antitoxin (DNA-binding transcriptional repressor) of toxin-antitoxin stability system
MNYVSTKELRTNFNSIKTQVESGKTFILLHRSKPVMRLKPIKGVKRLSKEEKLDRDLKKIDELSGSFSFGRGRTPKQMNEDYEKEVYQKL